MSLIDEINVDDMTVTVQGGATLGQVCRFLSARGCALSMSASLPHITVAGAIGTGTHGSGLLHRNLASQVAAIEFVTHNGETRHYKRGDPDFNNCLLYTSPSPRDS
eukprot:TRINITY_DN18246_c0_g1_i1.p1 TRINITY_DN18246_c0_g1~~TRINITY_DN18246_c0_g1_i1.p1  ORF type:complete len:106 (+),score=18.87 TRINITY_DN18246_c0_g1_i1:240-557(+)